MTTARERDLARITWTVGGDTSRRHWVRWAYLKTGGPDTDEGFLAWATARWASQYARGYPPRVLQSAEVIPEVKIPPRVYG